MFQNQVKKKSQRKKDRERFWNQVEKEKEVEKKKGEDGDRSGYTCVVEKKQEEKKKHMDKRNEKTREKKKKKNIWIKEMKNNIKNKKLQFKNATTIFSQ